MKKCINCGREIPDDAVFCGFCGTRQPENENTEEKNLTPVSEEEQVTSDPVSPDASDQKEVTEDSESKKQKTEEVKDSEKKPEEDNSEIRDAEIVDPSDKEDNSGSDHPETEEETESEKESEHQETEKVSDAEDKPDAVETAETEKQPSEEDDSEIKDAGIADSSEEASDSQNTEGPSKSEGKTDSASEKEDQEEEFSSEEPKKKKPRVQMKKIDLPKIKVSREDFNVLLDIVQNPVERHGIDNTTTWIILIFAWIANWIAFGSFSAGFFSLLIVLTGMIFIDWLNLKDHATFGETVRNSAETIFTPSLLVFAGGLFIRNVTAGAEVFAFHSIFTTAFIGLFFLTAALILFLLTVIKRYEMKIWQIVLILTIFVSLLIWYLMTSGAIALFS